MCRQLDLKWMNEWKQFQEFSVRLWDLWIKEILRLSFLTVILFHICRPAYLSVCDRISTEIGWQYGCTLAFLKIRTQSFQKVWKSRQFVASEVDHWVLMELSFVGICIFQAISQAEIYGWSWLVKEVFKQTNIDFAFEALRKLTIFWYGGFEFEPVGDKWLHETDEEEEEIMKPRKQTLTRQQPFKKRRVSISESSTHVTLLLEKVFCGLRSRTTFADVNKIKSSEYSASV